MGQTVNKETNAERKVENINHLYLHLLEEVVTTLFNN